MGACHLCRPHPKSRSHLSPFLGERDFNLSNAIDALDEFNNTRSLQDIADDPVRITIATEQISNHQIQIRLADNGSGISEPVQRRLFEPFFTTKPVGKGTELGLSISYQLAIN